MASIVTPAEHICAKALAGAARDGPALALPVRRLVTDLPVQLALLPGEAELVHQHLKDCLAKLFEKA